jgi:NaMN:DMB phosphoribosyltransferase
VDFVLEMRTALVETFSCIVQGSSDDAQSLNSLSPSIPVILSYLKSIIALRESEYEVMVNDSLVKAAVGLIGDMASAYSSTARSSTVSSALKESWVGNFLAAQKRRRNLPDSIDTVLRYALSQMARI